MYMANIVSSVGRFFNAANAKADRLTTIAKGALCLPAIITSLPNLGKNLIGNTKANLSVILTGATSIVSDLITNAINTSISQLTGSITGVINTAQGLVASVAGVKLQAEEFVKGLKGKATDIKDFTSKKENCNFAAASLLNCITSQALSNVTTKGAVDISKGLKSVNSFTNEISESITSKDGAIDRTINKAAGEVDRATRTISAANRF